MLRSIDRTELWRAGEEVTSRYNWLARSGDGRQVLAAADDNNVYLWDLDAPATGGAGPRVFAGHHGAVLCAEFSMDETRIATESADDSIRVWNRALGATVLRLHHEDVQRVAFTGRGQLVSAGRDGTVRWWWLEAEPLKAAVRALGIRELTDEELERVPAHLAGK